MPGACRAFYLLNDEEVSDYRAADLDSAGHHDLGPDADRRDARSHAAIAPAAFPGRELAPDSRAWHGRRDDAGDRVRHRRARRELHRRTPGQALECDPAPHSV